MVQFSFSISSSGNSLPGTTCSLDRLSPPWTWCQRRGFLALLRLCKPWDEVPGPLTNTAEYCCCCWILTTAKCRYKPLTCEKCFPGKRIALGNTGSAAGLLTLQSCLAHCDLGQVPHYSEPKDLKQYLAHNQQSKPWHLWSWCVLLFYHGIRHFLKKYLFLKGKGIVSEHTGSYQLSDL